MTKYRHEFGALLFLGHGVHKLTDSNEKPTPRPTNVGMGNKNLAIANISRVSCAHNTLRASIGINITP